MSAKIMDIIGFCILSALFGCVSCKTCYYYSLGYYGSDYCFYDCCSSLRSDPCCSSSSYSSYYYNYLTTYYTINAAAIAGIVIGCLVAAGIVISIIVCVCLAQRRNRRPYGGQVIQTGQPGIAYVTTNASNMQQQGIQGGYYNTGFGMGPSNNTGNVAQPPPSYNTATQNPDFQTPDPTNPDAKSTY